MNCKWEEMRDNPRQSDYSMADVIHPCNCERCIREREQDAITKELKKKLATKKK